MRFQFFGPSLAARPVISVDGICPHGPNFSHWPGNRTPRHLKADTSTEIALALARLPANERQRELDGLDLVSNNHFDSDGVLSCFAILEPELSLRHADRMTRAARAGDFQTFIDEESLAIDLAILRLGSNEGPHRGELAKSSGPERGQRQYEIALAAVPALLRDPFAFRDLIDDALTRELRMLEYGKRQARVERHEESSFVIVESDLPLTRLAANTLAGNCVRVLTQNPDGDRWRYRFHERVETWFDLASSRPVERRSYDPLVHRLNELETTRGDAKWITDPSDSPVVELWFGMAESSESFTELDEAKLAASGVKPRLVRAAFLDHFSGGG